MADEKPKMVTVEALEWHTYDNNAYDVGDTYDIDEQFLDSLVMQGKAVRADRVKVAKDAKAAAAKTAKPARGAKAAKRGKTAVEPMGTTNAGRGLAKPRAMRAGRTARSNRK